MTPYEQYITLESNLNALIGQVKFSAEINLKLERITHLLMLMGNPHHQFPTIHVGGTSGKGSTATDIADRLIACGYKTGLHLSPHLQLLNERHQINRIVAPTSTLLSLLHESKGMIEQVDHDLPFGLPSYFEVQFALSCLYFARNEIDVAVIEVGLGGRLDATNVLPAQIAVLTNVGLDHTDILGDTIEEIISDKAGIIKSGQHVITGVTQPSARQIIADKCTAVGATLHIIEEATNTTMAKAAVQAFTGKASDIPYPKQPMAGRMERIQSKPMVILDGAHNPDKMRYAAAQLPTDQKVILIISMKAGKDIAKTVRYAIPHAKQVIITQFQLQGLWEAVPAETIAQHIQEIDPMLPISIYREPIDALNHSLDCAKDDDVIWATGSLYLIGNLRQQWYPNKQLIEAAEHRLHGSLQIDPIDDYHQQHQWLLGLITDPDGLRYLTPRTKAEYHQNCIEQLARMHAFLDFSGNPEQKFKAIHVAGTSGKGSVTTMISALLTACGERTADHVSPYLQLCNEKLQIDGKMISPSRFAQLIRTFRPLYESWVAQGNILKYGEAWVALTFLYFAQEKVKWGVVETGVGGRYDPTNVMHSVLSVITNVDMDHVHSLGPRLEDIGHHKAGIIKANRAVITAATKPSIIALIEAEAERKHAPLHRIKHDDYTMHDDGTLSVRTPYNHYDHLTIPISSNYQKLNMATAITAVDQLAHSNKFRLTNRIIEKGLQTLYYPGRFEIMQEEPTIIIDGAHNPHKMASFVRGFQELYPNKKPTVLLGMIIGKSAEGMLTEIIPIAKHIIVSTPTVFGKPAQPIKDVIEAIQLIDPTMPCTAAPTLHQAIEAWLITAKEDEILVITGSIYLIGEARERWHDSRQILLDLEKEETAV